MKKFIVKVNESKKQDTKREHFGVIEEANKSISKDPKRKGLFDFF